MSSSDDTVVLQTIGHDLIQSFVSVTVETFVIGELQLARRLAAARTDRETTEAIYSVLVFTTGRLLL